MKTLPQELRQKIINAKQDHLFQFLPELDAQQFDTFKNQLNNINWEEIPAFIENYVKKNKSSEKINPNELQPAPFYPINPPNQQFAEKYSQAKSIGENLIRSGKIAILTVAGGQGTRLGYDGPKGTFKITPVKGKSFFQYFSEKIRRANQKFNTKFHWLIMTSPTNHSATVNFFEQHSFFNLDKNYVHFFTQGTMPAFSFDGKILLESKSSLALSPDGHGGTIKALSSSGLLNMLFENKIEIISYFQIDNILAPFLDPLFIGLHHIENSDVSSRMLPKRGPFEKLGNFCIKNNKLYIIEYSDMPDELAQSRDQNGRLKFIAGSPAIHLFNIHFLKQLTDKSSSLKLPWHRAEKKVPYINQSGDFIKPDKPNAVKLEMFIFDTLPLANTTLILEAVREDSFAPVKNQTGEDSVESAQALLSNRDARWLENAGIKVPRNQDGSYNCIIELSPLKFFDQDDVISNKSSISQPQPNGRHYYE